MKKVVLFCLLLFFVTIAQAQKKLVPATKSVVTGIGLPYGTRQDGRVLSQSVAGFLMETESDKGKTTLRVAEVLVLPPVAVSKFDRDSLLQRLSSGNWTVIATEGDQYLWLQKGQSFVLTYFAIEPKRVNLYFAETTGAPDFNAAIESSTSSQPATQVIEPVAKAVVLPAASPVNRSLAQPVNEATERASGMSVDSPIVGTWRRGKGVTMYGGRWSSTGYQYSFNANGTYTYIIKTYLEDDPETLLTREGGMFWVNGNTITLDPKTNVIEAWSKSNGGDNYKALITSQNKPLEKVTYQFAIQFVPELRETGLFLIYSTETARDGKYNGTDAFPNGWRFSPAGPDYKPIKLPGE